MKKVLFFAAMLSFAVACGGEKKTNNAEEATVEATEVVEETVVEEAPAAVEAEVKEEAPAVVETEAVAAEEVKAEEATKLQPLEANPRKVKKELKVDNKKELKVTESNLSIGSSVKTE